MSRKYFVAAAIIVGCCIVLSCSVQQILDELNVQKPDVRLKDVKLSGLSFDAADLVFDFTIQNPNGIGIQLAGFNYDFQINDNSFLSGNQEKGLAVAARGQSSIQLPLSLKYQDIFQTYNSLQNRDSSDYALFCEFIFDLPILGPVKIPLKKSGHFPVIKMPSIKIRNLKLNRLTLSGADLALNIEMKNPNTFKLFLDQLDYQFFVNQKEWIRGEKVESVTLNDNGTSVLQIPIRLNLIQMGQSVYQIISGQSNIDYDFQGHLNLSTSHPLLGKSKLPFDKIGRLKISR